MNTLIIDTSTEKSMVAFAHGVNVLLKILLPPSGRNSQHLMATVEQGLKQLNLTPDALEAIAVGTGPGSYTGIRVAAAAAKGLAFPRSLPLIGFCSLEGFISEKEGRFASLIDARIGGAYVLLQERKGEQISLLSDPTFISKEELPLYLDAWPEQAGPHLSYPEAHHLACLVYHKLTSQSFTFDLDLLYLRTPSYAATSGI